MVSPKEFLRYLYNLRADLLAGGAGWACSAVLRVEEDIVRIEQKRFAITDCEPEGHETQGDRQETTNRTDRLKPV